MELGTMALGGEKQLADWKGQGLKISTSTIKAAFQAFQNSISEQIKENSEPGGLIINRHEIVKNSHTVPKWLEQEYTNSLSSIENS